MVLSIWPGWNPAPAFLAPVLCAEEYLDLPPVWQQNFPSTGAQVRVYAWSGSMNIRMCVCVDRHAYLHEQMHICEVVEERNVSMYVCEDEGAVDLHTQWLR